jgi:Rrf2 family protein
MHQATKASRLTIENHIVYYSGLLTKKALNNNEMKLSVKSEYACLALLYLAEHYEKGLSITAEIAEKQEIPKKFLEQILVTLKYGGYLQSRKGKGGGYWMVKDPGSISIAEIIRLMDGALAPIDSVSKYFYKPTPIMKHKPLLRVFQDIRDYTANKLETTTFGDLIRPRK